ncbi:dihydropteroate synthase [Brevibacillus fluminis]|uniref:Dihydropteroate synthase n=1 Tax=Brevibacillus fluminis TaxID=511487 RepID=A0A3M8D5X7_9BACL|nr:dihydropteroate synthase [Brevibacillus fluminis]RNB82827.1 dihydropteroate synthase [Brevibacillus fluminis]
MKHNPYMIHTTTQEQIVAEMNKIGSDPSVMNVMASKAEMLHIRLENVSLQAALLLKQELRAFGGDCVVHQKVPALDIAESSVLIVATREQLFALLRVLCNQPFGLKELVGEIEELLRQQETLKRRKELVCGPHRLPLGDRTLVMGILNMTPDSFSDGGCFNDIERALAYAKEMIDAGADIIDIGGESTRPGHVSVSAEEELERVIPIITALSRAYQIPISVDTYKAEVADRAIEAGAHIINDVWGAKYDKQMAHVAAKHDVPIILMHNRENREYNDFFTELVGDLRESVQIAFDAGVKAENIILDPGIGFVKSHEQNLETMRRLDDIVALGYPVLLGTSRKSMIGRVLDLPPEERLEGTAATVALGVAKGCHIMRIHDVKEMKRLCIMMDAMLRGGTTHG